MSRRVLVLAGAVAVVAIAAAVVSTADRPPATVADRAAEVASGLRCPVCQNLSVADSPSDLAGEMRREIERRLRAGQDEGDVRAYFVDRYGEWVLLEPPRSGLNLLPWVFPATALAIGAAAWWIVVRRRLGDARDGGVAPTEEEQRRIDRELRTLEEPP